MEKPSSENNSAHIKLWVGNLSNKVTEYQLLKIFERFGNVSQFDFLYHISESGKRTPRGYAFITYSDKISAENALKSLNKTKLLDREIIVRLANPKTDHVCTPRAIIPAALKAGSKTVLSKSEKAQKIKELESKLKFMENSSKNEFEIVNVPERRRMSKPYEKLK